MKKEKMKNIIGSLGRYYTVEPVFYKPYGYKKNIFDFNLSRINTQSFSDSLNYFYDLFSGNYKNDERYNYTIVETLCRDYYNFTHKHKDLIFSDIKSAEKGIEKILINGLKTFFDLYEDDFSSSFKVVGFLKKLSLTSEQKTKIKILHDILIGKQKINIYDILNVKIKEFNKDETVFVPDNFNELRNKPTVFYLTKDLKLHSSFLLLYGANITDEFNGEKCMSFVFGFEPLAKVHGRYAINYELDKKTGIYKLDDYFRAYFSKEEAMNEFNKEIKNRENLVEELGLI